MTTISAPNSASSDRVKGWESALSRIYTDWNHEEREFKMFFMFECVKAAFEHPLSPFEAAQNAMTNKALGNGSEMDINQWYRMLQAGKWHEVVEQLLPTRFEENATTDGTPPVVTDEDRETANRPWETVLCKRFTGWEVDMSGDDPMMEAVWPSLKSRLLWALELPSSTLSPSDKDTIRQAMKTVDASTISEVFDLLKAGQWLKGVIQLGSLSEVETSDSLKDIMKHWADDFQGVALTVWGRRLIRGERIFERAERAVKKDPKKAIGHYAKTIDIVQSSGMGKSRLVSEMAKKVMTITFVLRKPGQTGFPPGDKEVLDFVLAGKSKSMRNTHMRAMCLLGGTFFEGQYSSIPRSRCQADVTVAKWCKSKSTSSGTLLEKWNDEMSPLRESLLPKKTDLRSDSRVDLYKSIIKKAEEYRKKLVDGTIPGGEQGSKWDWKDKQVVCLCTMKLTHFPLLMLFSFRTIMARKSS
jgi:hypothetical protein